MRIKINKTNRFSKSLGGELHVDRIFVCYTLEHPWRWNQKNISCILSATYTCFWRYDRGRIQVENIFCLGITRVAVQIHAGWPRGTARELIPRLWLGIQNTTLYCKRVF